MANGRYAVRVMSVQVKAVLIGTRLPSSRRSSRALLGAAITVACETLLREATGVRRHQQLPGLTFIGACLIDGDTSRRVFIECADFDDTPLLERKPFNVFG